MELKSNSAKSLFRGNIGQPVQTVEDYFKYETPENFSAAKLAHLKEDLDLKPGAKILDVGCGRGKLVTLLRKNGYEALGVDPTDEFVQAANSKWVSVAPAEKLPFNDEQFDAVVCAYVLEWLWTSPVLLGKALLEMMRVVKLGGVVFISVLRPDSIPAYYNTGVPAAPWWFEWMRVLSGFQLVYFSSAVGTYFFKLRKAA